jgi:predicted Fe-Mo cluster-binding NifX family protein
MIAIPVDSASPGVKSSTLFGNAEMFAVYKPVDEEFYFVRNPGAGDGVATAKQLKKWDIDSVVYSYMGNGPFGALQEDGVDIYFIGKEPMPLFEIVKGLEDGSFVKVDESNAETYLDPGTATGKCGCGCNH